MFNENAIDPYKKDSTTTVYPAEYTIVFERRGRRRVSTSKKPQTFVPIVFNFPQGSELGYSLINASNIDRF